MEKRNIYIPCRSMPSKPFVPSGFEDLLDNFNLSEKRRIKFTIASKISSILGFVTSSDPHQMHRIYGRIS